MPNPVLEQQLNAAIAFHRKWRRITSFSYFAGASLSVVSATTATVVAGFGYASAASIVAALATIFTSLEKLLLFRGKWTHHRAAEAQLGMVCLRYMAGQIDDKATVDQIERITHLYTTNVPIAEEETR